MRQTGARSVSGEPTVIHALSWQELFGMEGAVRVSPLHCHTFADVDRFLEVTREICMAFGG
ncbi:hypothetical protein EEB15_22895 [Ramlibacter sp. WS9]|nr:hypothetical protein EEB15_22895 [Ramlibacter sp. WS9]